MQWLISLSRIAKTKQNANENANKNCNPLGRNSFWPLRESSNPSHSAKTKTLKPQWFRGFLLVLLGFLDIALFIMLVKFTLGRTKFTTK
jgi:hypothetical protein